MEKTITKSPAKVLYETDFYAWTREQARLLRERRWDDLDLENLVDEVESVGGSEKREIRNRLTKLIAHLLKWQYQPGSRGSSWRTTIRDQRRELAEIIHDSPSLRAYVHKQARERYLSGRLEAADETGIAFGLFPDECPFTPEQVLSLEFWPEDRSIE
jgi:hypothetical protein